MLCLCQPLISPLRQSVTTNVWYIVGEATLTTQYRPCGAQGLQYTADGVTPTLFPVSGEGEEGPLVLGEQLHLRLLLRWAPSRAAVTGLEHARYTAHGPCRRGGGAVAHGSPSHPPAARGTGDWNESTRCVSTIDACFFCYPPKHKKIIVIFIIILGVRC